MTRSAKIDETKLISPKFKTSEEGSNDESYPEHNLMPAYVYIGRSKKSNPIVAVR